MGSSNSLLNALREQGLAPCFQCESESICATGLACKAFLRWHSSTRAITDPWVWVRSRREKAADWQPSVRYYEKIFRDETTITSSSGADEWEI